MSAGSGRSACLALALLGCALSAGAQGHAENAAPATRAAVGAWLEASRNAPAAFAAGQVIGRAELEKLRPFLPPGLYDDFQFGGVSIEVTPTQPYPGHPAYREATLRHAGQATLGERGALENDTAGRPFSEAEIEAADPATAGTMAVWNYNFRWQYYGAHMPSVWTAYCARGKPGRAVTPCPRVSLAAEE